MPELDNERRRQMKTRTGEEVSDMTEYLESLLGNGDRGEPEYVDTVNTEGVAVFGRYVFEWISTGARWARGFESNREAVQYAEDWHLDRFAPEEAFDTRRACTVDLEYFGLEGVVIFRNFPTACTVNIYYNGAEVDVFTLSEPVDSFGEFERHCREWFAGSEFSEGDTP